MAMTPDDRKYTKSHEWIKVEVDIAVVGITDHAQEEMGDITFVELPSLGESVEAGTECAVIESVKAASDILAPVAGEIVEVNQALEEAPELVNESAYEDGWLFKMRGFDEDAVEALMDADEYEASLKEDK
jgi:glycine cleavage system H protein